VTRALAIASSFAVAWTAAATAAAIQVSATPVLGADAPSSGWSSYVVNIQGEGDGVRHGTVEITDGSGDRSRAHFAVAASDRVEVELSYRDVFGRGLEVVVRDESDRVVARTPVPSSRSRSPLLFDLGRTGRLESALRGERVPVRAGLGPWPPVGGAELVVTHAATDHRSGEPVLPARGLAYGGATVVLSGSDELVAMPAQSFAALEDWVQGGGALAVVVSRPEDLRQARVTALLEGTAVPAPFRGAEAFTEFEVVEEGTGGAASPSPAYVSRRVSPSEDVASRLVGYSGPSVHATRWGARAGHGLGDVHLLSFDPTAPAFVDDAWVRRSMVELVRSTWDRRAVLALSGAASADESRLEPVRRLLDPNESNRWAIGFAALLLVAYAVVAVPLTFRRAARRNAPLKALVELPLWSAVTLAAIVATGIAAKGGRARARHLSLVECASGARRGLAAHIRGFFASSARSLRVSARDPSSLLELAAAPAVTRTLVQDHGLSTLEDLHGRPWETLLVREDGFVDLGGSVSLDGDTVINRLPHALVGVVARAPHGELRYLGRVQPGATASIAAGSSLGSPVGSPTIPVLGPSKAATSLVAHRLEAYRFASPLDASTPGLGAAWSALESALPDSTDFWPEDRSTLIAEVEGADPSRTDSGLAVDRTRLLVRVIGNGEAR